MYLYKLASGECWFEYIEDQTEHDPEKKELLDSLDEDKVVELVTKQQE